MSALINNRNTPEREARFRRYLVLNGEIIYAGGIAAILGSSGEVEMASDKAGLIVVGRAEEYVDNSSDGLQACVKTGCFLFANSESHAVSVANIGSVCYVENDNTVSTSPGTNAVIAGIVFDVVDSGVWVEISPDVIDKLSVIAAVQAAATLAAPVITDSTTGTTSATHVVVAPASTDYSAAELKANFATLIAEHNALRTDLAAVNAVASGLISKLKAANLMATA